MILAIDPGITGAMAVLGRKLGIYDFKKIKEGKKNLLDMSDLILNLREVFYTCDIKMICFEKVHAMPKQGVSSMFAFGRTVGQLEGILSSLSDIPITYISPQVWKGYHNLLKQPKKASVELCRIKYPGMAWPISKDGRSDAALMAEYGRYLASHGR